jgi:hypothetical protein
VSIPGRTLFQADDVTAAGDLVDVTIKATPVGLVVVVGDVSLVRLDRVAAQQLRHAVTEWLVDAAPGVDPVQEAS